ncbi:MFS transporter [Cellulomonas sp. URHB0016]
MTGTAGREPLGRAFAAHLTSSGLANLGDGVLQTGAPLVALTLTRSPAQIALLTAAAWLPWLVGGLMAGVVVDRRDRRTTRAAALGVRAAILALAVVVVATGHLTMPFLVALCLAYGVTEVFADLAGGAIVPDLVPRSRLQAANGRLLAVEQVANAFLGAPIAGAALALGAGWVFGIPAGLAVAAVALMVLGVRGSYRHEAPADGPQQVGAQVREGVAFLVHHPVLRPVLVGGGLMNLASTAYFSVFVLWVVGDGSRIGMTAQSYPLVLTVLAVGAVLGSLLAEPLHRVVPDVRLMLACWLSNAALLVVPVVAPTVPALCVTAALLGLTNTLGNVVGQSVRQRIVPAGMLGRVGGAGRTIGFGLMPVGAVLGGAAAERWGLPTVFLGATVLSVLAAVYVSLVLRQRMVDEAERALVPTGGTRPDADVPVTPGPAVAAA